MPAILTNNLSVINAENFVDSFVNGNSNIFMAIGKGYEREKNETIPSDAQSKNAWTDEMNPPVPLDSLTEQKNFRDTILGLKRILLNDILIMIPRVDWVENSIFRPKSMSDKVGVRATDYYCINSENEVWECVQAPADENKGVSKEPLFEKVDTSSASKNISIVNPITGKTETYWGFKESEEGYWWKYLYTIPVEIANKKLLPTWMPVMFNKHGMEGGTITDEQHVYGDSNANRTLGAYRVMVSCTLSDEDTKIPYDTIYRQIGLIVDPLDIKSGEGDVQERLGGSLYNQDEFDIYSGELVYLENKRAIMREQNQEETLNLILVF